MAEKSNRRLCRQGMYSKIIIILLVASVYPVFADYEDDKPRFKHDPLYCIDARGVNEKKVNVFVNALQEWQDELPDDFYKLNYVLVTKHFKYAQCDVIVHFKDTFSSTGHTYIVVSTLSGRYSITITLSVLEYCQMYDNCLAELNTISQHEIGHTLGLIHDDVPLSIMQKYVQNAIVITKKNVQDVIEFYDK